MDTLAEIVGDKRVESIIRRALQDICELDYADPPEPKGSGIDVHHLLDIIAELYDLISDERFLKVIAAARHRIYVIMASELPLPNPYVIYLLAREETVAAIRAYRKDVECSLLLAKTKMDELRETIEEELTRNRQGAKA